VRLSSIYSAAAAGAKGASGAHGACAITQWSGACPLLHARPAVHPLHVCGGWAAAGGAAAGLQQAVGSCVLAPGWQGGCDGPVSGAAAERKWLLVGTVTSWMVWATPVHCHTLTGSVCCMCVCS
jgi:hypothetical protein